MPLTVMNDLGCADTPNVGTPCRMGGLPRANAKVDRRAAEAAILFHMIFVGLCLQLIPAINNYLKREMSESETQIYVPIIFASSAVSLNHKLFTYLPI